MSKKKEGVKIALCGASGAKGMSHSGEVTWDSIEEYERDAD